MRRDERSSPRLLTALKGSWFWQTVCHTVCVTKHSSSLLFSCSHLLLSDTSLCFLSSLSSPWLRCCASVNPALPFSCLLHFLDPPLFFLPPVATSLADVTLRRLVYCCNKSSAPFISCHPCYRELEMCALSTPLSPLTATFPLYHQWADQIGAGPSHSVLDKWKVAVREDL